jgi:hypothetical protein
MRRIPTVAAAVAGLLFLGLGPAQAEWSMSQRGKFMGDCIPACEANPNVHASRKPQCGLFCNCLANEGEKIFSSAEFQEMDEAAQAGRDTPKTQRFHALVPACNREAFGQ